MANQLFNNGRYQEAGELFEQIAAHAEAEDSPNAHHFYYFASRAKSMCGNDLAAVELVLKGLGLLIRDKRWSELERTGIQVVQELIDRDRYAEATQIRTFLTEQKIDISHNLNRTELPIFGNLPTFCPNCGATIYRVGIEWLNKHTAICNYCAAPIKVERS